METENPFESPQTEKTARPKEPTPKSASGLLSNLNHAVFWPPFLLLLGAIVLNFIAPDQIVDGEKVSGGFSKTVDGANDWILGNFGWVFSLCACLALTLCVVICFSGFSKVRIGGRDAKPLMSMWNWFSITICTTIAIGILFWSTAEPISHFAQPPARLGIQANSPAAATFALSTMYLHWSFVPYSLYCVASLMFAFAYYNMKKPFSLGSTLTPLLGNWATGKGGNIIDAVCLYALVAGMAAALGTGILMLAGGMEDLFNIPSNSTSWFVIAATIVATFIVSSATGLMNGIRILSDINTKLLFCLAFVPLIFGPTLFLLTQGGESLLDFVIHFIPRTLYYQADANGVSILAPDQWGKDWTVFYWAVWLAWAPITACFLGRIAYGRTVREFMLVNFIFPSLFGIVWMTIFGGTAIHLQMNEVVDLHGVYQGKGAEAVSFAMFKQFPLANVLIIFYMFSAFVCFVTSSDSNMSAMASISSTGISPQNPEGNKWLKIIWGVSVGAVAWIMISFTGGVKGVKMLSNLGGFPAAFLELFIIAALIRVVIFHKSLNLIDQDDKATSNAESA
ncbi:MAG: BCCT family transporter [Mariniblastus sp.]